MVLFVLCGILFCAMRRAKFRNCDRVNLCAATTQMGVGRRLHCSGWHANGTVLFVGDAFQWVCNWRGVLVVMTESQ